MTVTPAVSVIVPAYNGEALIADCLLSVLAQSWTDLEVVVVDDGSTDGTAVALAAIGDPRVRVVRQANSGTAAARNRGVRECRADLIAFLDQDDEWDRDKLARELPLLDEPGVDLVHSGVRFVDVAGEVTSVVRGDPDIEVHDLLEHCCVAIQSVVVRRSLMERVGSFDTTLSGADDWDMWIRCAAASRFAAHPEPLVTIRVHPGNQSNDADLMYDAAHRLLAKHARLHPDCADCRRALTAAARSNRREYYRRMREQSRLARAAGLRWEAVQLTARGLARHPAAVIETTKFHAARFRRSCSRRVRRSATS